MATKEDRQIGLSMAAAGVGINGAAVVFGLTANGGGIDWVGVVTGRGGRADGDHGPSRRSGAPGHTASEHAVGRGGLERTVLPSAEEALRGTRRAR